ncbi:MULTISPECIES: DNA polymerase III subunit alpha [Bacillus cereus group]|uniref:DNA polymerase III subunit alpha n=1 Tax=Bacillus cereus TaxID=1396 RepID=A0A9X6W224_BACCE|nr:MULTISPECIES: DNA polymerase III subunit alpha [Bacillus cereus group]PEZ74928.1 DNA polymerase III subunit alpha [Bacillus anthracis]PES55313.1 DNA polymerase III subunit alpha [Bacillus cereus]PFA29712.1 DNA polymerase III subunit alpha [Bacillus thuringiensis]PFF51803.1 DNA polymerase III subunit alpha [Bacillus cereus]PGB10072.1 DNA polymerase III subunit alpha [Bacillus toyonensis]
MQVVFPNLSIEKGTIVELHLEGDKVAVKKNKDDNFELICTLPLNKFEKNNRNLFERRQMFRAVVNGNVLDVVRYVSLHGHTGYSLLDGATKIHEMVAKTEWASAITDHGVMYGTLDFYKKMKKANKKPILGFEAYIENLDGKKEGKHQLLLAINATGYRNLVKLTSMGFENKYYKPHVKLEWLEKYSEGVVSTSSCLGGLVPQAIIKGDMDLARKTVQKMIDIFGKENYYIEIQRHGCEEEEVVNPALLQLAEEFGLKAIATSDSHYTEIEDASVHEILLCIGTKTTMDDPNRMVFPGSGYHIHTSEEMEDLFWDMPELLDNTLDLAERINIDIQLGEIYLPEFPLPEGFESQADYFEHLAWEGFAKRFKGQKEFKSKEYRERLTFEIETIKTMGFPGYFVIVWDFIRFAKERGILVGPGRGSACGSLVAYALDITDIDPIPYGLIFERFLNPDRISMPDIDIDFEDTRREEVIDYVKELYGEEAVSRIITFGTLAAKVSVRDVARVLDKPLGNMIANAIPEKPGMTLNKALNESPEFYNMYHSDAEVKEIVDIALRIEGLPRNVSQHACGVIIAPSAVTDHIPQVLLENTDTGAYEHTTQYNKDECEEMGLLKMDFLGLRTMGVMGRAFIDINKKRKELGLEPITLESIPLDDIRVYEYIAKGNTAGVFQLESAGMTNFMMELFQDAHTLDAEMGKQLFERLIAGISLYRPGPLDEIPNYIKNMLKPEGIEYDVPQLQPILETTYNIIVYQEQCMFIVRELANFTRGQSDTIRKGMAKKVEALLNEYGEYFVHGSEEKGITGCVANGIDEHIAIALWERMKKFGRYAFNKSHATGYANIAIKTGFLAYYYPTEYMCATLNSFITMSDKIKAYMAVSKRQKIDVLPPDVNKSREVFTVEGNSIRFGLQGIRNMGKISIRLIEERDTRGDFRNFQDCAVRMAKYQKVDRRVLEALIFSGAVDSFEGTRNSKLMMLDALLLVASQERKDYQSGQLSIFDIPLLSQDKIREVLTPTLTEFNIDFKLEKEKEFAGFYISAHPLDSYETLLAEEEFCEIGFLQDTDEKDEADRVRSYKKSIRVAGIITEIETYYTKKDNKPLNVFKLEDTTGEIKCVAFSNVLEQSAGLLHEGSIIAVEGKFEEDDRGTQIMVKRVIDIHDVGNDGNPKEIVLLGSRNVNNARKQFVKVRDYLKEYESEDSTVPVYFIFGGNTYKVNYTHFNLTMITQMQEIVGKQNCRVNY